MIKTVENDILGVKCKITATYAYRSWCRGNRLLIHELNQVGGLRHDNTRYWEYPWAYKMLNDKYGRKNLYAAVPGKIFVNFLTSWLCEPKQDQKDVIDIGAGDGSFSLFLQNKGYYMTAVDNYKGGWEDLKKDDNLSKIEFQNADCSDLSIFADDIFDASLMVSVIEHIPTNMIYGQDGVLKTVEQVKGENKDRLQVIKEAIRITKPGGILVMTSDVYIELGYFMSVRWNVLNIDWNDLLGIPDFVPEIHDTYICDIPAHKGRIIPIGIVIEKGTI